MTVEVREDNAVVTYVVSEIKPGEEYGIPFKFLEDDEYVKVYVRKEDNIHEDLELDQDYAVRVSDGTGGAWGIITIKSARKGLKKLCIYRDVPISQEKRFDSQTIFSGTMENALDKLTMLQQDNQFKNRTIHAPNDDKLEINSLELPPLEQRAGKYLYFNDQGVLTATNAEKSLRQGFGEPANETFELNLKERKGKFIAFDDKGSVDLKMLSTVAISGSYNDLINKPYIPSVVDNVVSSSATDALSANQGKILNTAVTTLDASLKPVAKSGSYNDLINKPNLSTVAISGKYSDLTEKLTAGSNVQISGTTISATDTIYNNATSSVSGLMSAADKSKLDGVQSGAKVNVQSDWNISDTQNDAYIKNKPNIPAAQVNSDWNATSGKAQILNKPNLSTVATSGSYNDLSNKLVAGTNITIDSNNVISATGGGADITVGKGLQKNGNEISLNATYGGNLGGIYQNYSPENNLLTIEPDGQAYAQLPTSTASTLGGIKVGSGLTISSDGVLSTSSQQQPTLVAGSGIRIEPLKGFVPSYSSSVNINSIWFSRGVYIAVGDNGTILRSYDSKNWDKITVPNVTQNLYRVMVSGDYFYIVGSNETILKDYNGGLEWLILYQNTSSSQSLRGISYTGEGGGTFVAVGDYGTVLYGRDYSWTKTNVQGVPYLSGVTTGGGDGYIAVGNQGGTSYIFKSIYGSDWVKVYEQDGTQISFIYYSSGMYYTVRWNYSSNTLLTSSDGENWSIPPYTIPVDTKINSMYYSGTDWVLVGDNGVILRGNALNNLSAVSLRESVILKDVYYDYKEFYVLGGKNIYQESVIGQKISLA